MLWWIGALMVLVGGYWFWFFIRVDVAAEGHSPFRLVKADLFVLSLLASVTLGVIWAAMGARRGRALLALPPRHHGALLSACRGRSSRTCSSSRRQPSRSGYPRPTARPRTCRRRRVTIPSNRKRHSMELLRDAPMDMGLGIKREAPRHY